MEKRVIDGDKNVGEKSCIVLFTTVY